MTLLFVREGFRLALAIDLQEKAELLQFIRQQALISYQCEPPPSPGPIIGAWRGNQIVGTVALDFRAAQEPFPLEEVYEAAAFYALFPEGFNRIRVAQAGRWFSALRGSPVSALLLHTMSLYARQQGCSVIFGEAKDYAIRIFKRLGLSCTFLPTYVPNIAVIPLEARRYYEVPPLPHLFRIDL